MKRILASLVLLLAWPTMGVSAVTPETPPGFPYMAGNCGFGNELQNGMVVGVNCGHIGPDGGIFSCHEVSGGDECNFTFFYEADVARWVNSGSFRATESGACHDEVVVDWKNLDAFLPVYARLECGVAFFLPSNSCQEFTVVGTITFSGELAPEGYSHQPTWVEFCN
jgi:hypothetical protein